MRIRQEPRPAPSKTRRRGSRMELRVEIVPRRLKALELDAILRTEARLQPVSSWSS